MDTYAARPDPQASVRLGRDNITLRAGDEVITFVNRNLEPYRGYHGFIRALPDVLCARPRARAVIVGGDQVSYGPALANNRSWKDHYLEEVRGALDMSRIHFVGIIPHDIFLQLIQVSAAHIYFTYPFVLSWSMLQAMSAGALVIGSRTPPVEEVIQDGMNGQLVDFFDVAALSTRIIDVLARPEAYRPQRAAARRTVLTEYDLHGKCLPAWLDLVFGNTLKPPSTQAAAAIPPPEALSASTRVLGSA